VRVKKGPIDASKRAIRCIDRLTSPFRFTSRISGPWPRPRSERCRPCSGRSMPARTSRRLGRLRPWRRRQRVVIAKRDLRTSNPLQGTLREIGRRAWVVAAFRIASRPSIWPLRHCATSPGPPVDQESLGRRAAKGSADERYHHSLSQRRAPLRPAQKSEIFCTLPAIA
jgi:hypothetical protein